jgi:hypothetical protein
MSTEARRTKDSEMGAYEISRDARSDREKRPTALSSGVGLDAFVHPLTQLPYKMVNYGGGWYRL